MQHFEAFDCKLKRSGQLLLSCSGVSFVCDDAALQQKRIKGAALDVTEVEPLPKDSPLYELDNVLLSPHCADRTAEFQVGASQTL